MPMPRRWPKGYYSYLMLHPDGTPYYAGAGKGNRANPKHKRFAGVCVDEQAFTQTGKRTLVIITEHGDKATAFAHEEKLIQQYGRIDLGTGTLRNRTAGLGSKGMLFPASRSEKIAQAQRGRSMAPAHREAMRLRMLGNSNIKGHKHSDETKAKIALSSKGRKLSLSDEERTARSERIRQRNLTNNPMKRVNPCT